MSQSHASTNAMETRLVMYEAERAAQRLIKVHGNSAFDHAAQRLTQARKRGNEADSYFWRQIAEMVRRQLPAGVC